MEPLWNFGLQSLSPKNPKNFESTNLKFPPFRSQMEDQLYSYTSEFPLPKNKVWFHLVYQFCREKIKMWWTLSDTKSSHGPCTSELLKVKSKIQNFYTFLQISYLIFDKKKKKKMLPNTCWALQSSDVDVSVLSICIVYLNANFSPLEHINCTCR